LKNVTPSEDFQGEYTDLRQVMAGDTEATTGAPLEIVKTIEIGHIFKLGYKYSKSMNLKVLDQNGQEVNPIMGSYGIGIERILCAAVELYSDDAGMSLPATIAPFDLVLLPIGITTPAIKSLADKLDEELTRRGIQVLYDDREETAGVRFKDADLIGVPFRLTLGKKVSQGLAEFYERRTRQSQDVSLDNIVNVVAEAVGKAKAS
jgi:prolyl-tRNA synthetase